MIIIEREIRHDRNIISNICDEMIDDKLTNHLINKTAQKLQNSIWSVVNTKDFNKVQFYFNKLKKLIINKLDISKPTAKQINIYKDIPYSKQNADLDNYQAWLIYLEIHINAIKQIITGLICNELWNTDK